MDYEKKYKEALERARTMLTNEVAADIFPELTESEDERIRKALKEYFINSFQNNGVAAICGVHIKDILAWIERQGEQNTIVVIPKFRVGDVIRPKGSMEEYTIESISGECYHGKGWGLHISGDDNYELVEQKPVWSKEDDQYLLVCKNALAKYQVSDKWDATIISRWLEDKLKSLRPQKQWKPSDEQMKILNEVLNFAANHESPHWNDYIFGTLNNLIRQLKKLREE